MKHARDLMTKKPSTICEDDKLDDLLQLFLSTNYKAIPVVDKATNTIGIITELNLLKALSQKKADPKRVLVKDHQNCYSKPSFIHVDDSFGEFIPKILNSESNRAVVVSPGSKKALGIISPSNIIRAIVGLSPESARMKRELEMANTKANQGGQSEDAKDIFTEAFQTSPYMMVLADPQQNLIALNEQLIQNTLYTKEELLGRNIRQLFPSFAYQQITKALLQAKAEGEAPSQPSALLKKDTKYLNIDLAVSCILDEHKALKYYSVVFRLVQENEVYEHIPG